MHRTRPRTLLLLLPLLLGSAEATTNLHFASGTDQTSLIELYTSEGCSSCPAADRWLADFTDSKLLWQSVIPVAFHVDYWDYLGWQDRFADSRYARRQYTYQALGHVGTVYTPGVMVNGREWRGWRWRQAPEASAQRPGVLEVDVGDDTVQVSFHALQTHPSLLLNVAWLGTGLQSKVEKGENRGKGLRHDFVVLNLQQLLGKDGVLPYSWQLSRNTASKDPRVTAVAVWLSAINDPTPIQATGAWLK